MAPGTAVKTEGPQGGLACGTAAWGSRAAPRRPAGRLLRGTRPAPRLRGFDRDALSGAQGVLGNLPAAQGPALAAA